MVDNTGKKNFQVKEYSMMMMEYHIMVTRYIEQENRPSVSSTRNPLIWDGVSP